MYIEENYTGSTRGIKTQENIEYFGWFFIFAKAMRRLLKRLYPESPLSAAKFSVLSPLVELRGFEPLTSSLQIKPG